MVGGTAHLWYIHGTLCLRAACIPSPNPLASILDRREGPYPTATFSTVHAYMWRGNCLVHAAAVAYMHPTISGLVAYSKSMPPSSYQSTISYDMHCGQSPYTYAAETNCSRLFNVAGMLLSPYLLPSCNTG